MLNYFSSHGFGWTELAVFAGVTLAAAALMFFSESQSGSGGKFRRRMNRVSGQDDRALTTSDSIDAEMRRRQIRSAMKHGENKRAVSLKEKLRQAGLTWSMKTYLVITGICVIAVWKTLVLGFGQHPILMMILSVPLGAALPYLYVGKAVKNRMKKFSNEFPTALDIIVRGVSAGLPLSECMKTIANEANEPVRSEIAQVIADQSVGMPLDKAAHRLALRVPLAETAFFAIVLAVQSRSGGSLSEILTNLSSVVRGRKMLDAQIQTMSAEAKMSGRLIGAMPILVAAALFYLSPDYITILTTTSQGKMILAGCALWMFTGVMVMKKMINFKV